MFIALAILDVWLLSVTEKFVKRFNWLTGKDNFWLANKFAFPGAVSDGYFLLAIWSTTPWLRNISFIFYFALFWGLYTAVRHYRSARSLIRLSEQESEKSASSGAMNLHHQIALRLVRYTCLIALAVFPILTIFLFSVIVTAVVILSDVCSLVIFYLISVQKPPFKRSMAVEWLKNKAEELVPQSGPSPQPA